MSEKTASLLFVIIIAGTTTALALPASPFYYKTLMSGSLCRVPLSYHIETIDPRFGIDAETLASALLDAERIWERGALRDLFVASDESGIPVSLVFDERQQETHQLQSMVEGIQDGNTRYDMATAEYARLETEYQTARQSYDGAMRVFEEDHNEHERSVDQYNAAQAAYQQEVDKWNEQGGAPSEVYNRLNIEQKDLSDWYRELTDQAAELHERQTALEQERVGIAQRIRQLNQLAALINDLINELNLKIKDYNLIQGDRDEFVTGTYEHTAYATSITVYQFEDYEELVLVLAHEMGHALGIEHEEDPTAIMYPFIEQQEEFATPSDIRALNRVCPASK